MWSSCDQLVCFQAPKFQYMLCFDGALRCTEIYLDRPWKQKENEMKMPEDIWKIKPRNTTCC